MEGKARFRGHYKLVCRAPDGRVKWREEIHNIIPDAALTDLMDVYFAAGAQDLTWYIGLAGSTPTVAASDTMGSHPGWSEVEDYDEAARQVFDVPSAANQSVNNSANLAQFTCDTDSTVVGGAFLTNVSTKGGTTGVLYSVGAFSSGDKTINDNDTIDVQATMSASR